MLQQNTEFRRPNESSGVSVAVIHSYLEQQASPAGAQSANQRVRIGVPVGCLSHHLEPSRYYLVVWSKARDQLMGYPTTAVCWCRFCSISSFFPPLDMQSGPRL